MEFIRNGTIIFYLPRREGDNVFTTKRFNNGVSSFFPSLLRELKERGVFPTIFQFCLPAADRNPFLARDPQEKQGTLWSGVPRSIVADIRPFLLTLLLLRFSCPVSFLVFATDTIYSRTIELPLSTWTITRVSENNLFPFGTFSRIIVCPSKIES